MLVYLEVRCIWVKLFSPILVGNGGKMVYEPGGKAK